MRQLLAVDPFFAAGAIGWVEQVQEVVDAWWLAARKKAESTFKTDDVPDVDRRSTVGRLAPVPKQTLPVEPSAPAPAKNALPDPSPDVEAPPKKRKTVVLATAVPEMAPKGPVRTPTPHPAAYPPVLPAGRPAPAPSPAPPALTSIFNRGSDSSDEEDFIADSQPATAAA